MSIISNNNKSIEKESKSSQIIIISKNRLSSAKNNLNYMTIQDGDVKLTVQIKNELLNNNNIHYAIESIKQNILKHSKSFGKLEEHKNYFDLKSNNQKKSKQDSINEKEKEGKTKNKNMKKIKIKSILEIETTKSLNMKTTENNRDEDKDEDNNYDNNEKEINIKKVELINKDIDNNEKNLIDNNPNKNNTAVNEDDTINNDKTIEVNDNEEINENDNNNNNNINNYTNNNESNKNRKIISQNFFNAMDSNKKLKIPIKKLKSEEVKLVNKNDINENEEEKRMAERKNKQSEKTTRSILGSILEHKVIDNINNLITENGSEDHSVREDIRSKDDLLSEDKGKKIDENEDEDDEYEEVEDEFEYDEKKKNENAIIKNINNLNIKSHNFNTINNNNLNNKKNENEDFQKIKNEINKTKNNIDNGLYKCISLDQNKNNENNIYKMCDICEHTYKLGKCFVAECKVHYICKRCAKGYYEELIEDGIKDLYCPFFTCKAEVNFDNLKNVISQEHYKRLINICNNDYTDTNKNNFIFTKIKSNCNMEKIQLYTKKHVIDINSNKNFFEYNREKEGYCPLCYEKALFTKTNCYFYKCLNCLSKICRYCFKEYNEKHINMNVNMNYNEHCKVYYRLDEEERNNSKLHFLFLQVFFVFASFYLVFAGSFYFFKKFFFKLFNTYKTRNIFAYIIGYFFAIIFFIISFPFAFLLFPYFPSILALSDY